MASFIFFFIFRKILCFYYDGKMDGSSKVYQKMVYFIIPHPPFLMLLDIEESNMVPLSLLNLKMKGQNGEEKWEK